MHSKCHNATESVTRNDYLVAVSNALYRAALLWDVVFLFVRLNKQTSSGFRVLC